MANWRAALLSARKSPGLVGLNFNQTSLRISSTSRLRWQGVLFGFAVVGAGTALLLTFNMALYNVNMAFMLLTLFATVWFGLGAGVLTAILGFLSFDFFFLPPYFTFVIDAFQGWAAVFLFLGTALFANQVAGRARVSNTQAQRRAEEATALYDLATAVISRIDQREMLLSVIRKVSQALDAEACTLYLANETGEGESLLLESVRVESSSNSLTFTNRPQPDPDLAEAVFRQNRAAFYTEPVTLTPTTKEKATEPEIVAEPKALATAWAAIAYIPLAYGPEVLGIISLVNLRKDEKQGFSPEEKRLIQVFANHVALAVEHARLIKEAAQVAALRDSDKLKSALLASVSHELRTPLTSIKTATANLQSNDIVQTQADRAEVLGIIEEETDRLTRLVSNMLDLSKIEAHSLKPNFGWYFLPEIVMKVIQRLQNTPLVRPHPIQTSFASDLPLARMDFLQLDQVLTNLIENAAKYSAPGSTITVQVECQPISQLTPPPGKDSRYFGVDSKQETAQEMMVVKVLDEGQTVPPAEFERIFDKFYRIRGNSSGKAAGVPGTGLGLAINRGIIEAHDGKIWVQNRLYGGNVFTFILPVTPLDENPDFEED